jgi:hypothetical protein
MKLHWGTGAFLVFGLFAAFSIFQVYQSTKYDRSLVKDDYYVDDLELEKLIEKRQNAMNVSGLKVEEDAGKQEIRIIIPGSDKNPISGRLQLSSPVTSKDDMHFPLKMINDTMRLPLTKIRSGKWNILLEWSDNNKAYVYNESIILP